MWKNGSICEAIWQCSSLPSNIYCVQTVPGCLQSTAMLNRHRPFSLGSRNAACRKRDTRVHDRILPLSLFLSSSLSPSPRPFAMKL